MRIIAKRTLQHFWETHPRGAEAAAPLQLWFSTAANADWATPAEVKATFGDASILKNSRVVFNIGATNFGCGAHQLSVSRGVHPVRRHERRIRPHRRGDDLMEITVRPIRNEADYEASLALAETLMDAEACTPDGERLDVLVTLIDAYEARHWPIPAPDPIAAIRARMEQRELRARDLEPMIGSRGRVSEVLARKRALTLPMIRRLAAGLDLPAGVLIQEITLNR